MTLPKLLQNFKTPPPTPSKDHQERLLTPNTPKMSIWSPETIPTCYSVEIIGTQSQLRNGNPFNSGGGSISRTGASRSSPAVDFILYISLSSFSQVNAFTWSWRLRRSQEQLVNLRRALTRENPRIPIPEVPAYESVEIKTGEDRPTAHRREVSEWIKAVADSEFWHRSRELWEFLQLECARQLVASFDRVCGKNEEMTEALEKCRGDLAQSQRECEQSVEREALLRTALQERVKMSQMLEMENERVMRRARETQEAERHSTDSVLSENISLKKDDEVVRMSRLRIHQLEAEVNGLREQAEALRLALQERDGQILKLEETLPRDSLHAQSQDTPYVLFRRCSNLIEENLSLLACSGFGTTAAESRSRNGMEWQNWSYTMQNLCEKDPETAVEEMILEIEFLIEKNAAMSTYQK